MNSRRSLSGAREGVFLGFAATATAACSLPTQILFERSLGVQGFAQWSYLNSICSILIGVACLGASNLILSEFFRGRLETKTGLVRLMAYFGLSSFLAFFGFFGLYAWILLTEKPLFTGMPLELVVFLAQIPIVLIYPVFQIRGWIAQVALWPLLQNLARLLVAITAAVAALGYTSAVALWTIASLLLAGWAIRMAWRPIYSRVNSLAQTEVRSALQYGGLFGVVQSGLGFGATEVLDSLDLKLVVVLAGFFFGAHEISAATLAMLLVFAVYFFPYVLVMRLLLPIVHRYWDNEAHLLFKMIERICLYAVAFLLPVSIAMYFFGHSALALLVKGDYSSQEGVFKAVATVIIPLCLSTVGAAPFMSKRENLRLLRWRLESLALFIVFVLAFVRYLNLAALFWGLTANRTYLCIRFFWTLAQLRKTNALSTPRQT
ncbi:MAG TPA: hypothetical protein VI895_12605 [Bdellovibrionota bacterium]|nr:hypothetical protein [Bdellovibrionota bacterium]